MDRLNALYKQYLKSNSSVTFFHWLEGELGDNIDILVTETSCVNEQMFKRLCGNMKHLNETAPMTC